MPLHNCIPTQPQWLALRAVLTMPLQDRIPTQPQCFALRAVLTLPSKVFCALHRSTRLSRLASESNDLPNHWIPTGHKIDRRSPDLQFYPNIWKPESRGVVVPQYIVRDFRRGSLDSDDSRDSRVAMPLRADCIPTHKVFCAPVRRSNPVLARPHSNTTKVFRALRRSNPAFGVHLGTQNTSTPVHQRFGTTQNYKTRNGAGHIHWMQEYTLLEGYQFHNTSREFFNRPARVAQLNVGFTPNVAGILASDFGEGSGVIKPSKEDWFGPDTELESKDLERKSNRTVKGRGRIRRRTQRTRSRRVLFGITRIIPNSRAEPAAGVHSCQLYTRQWKRHRSALFGIGNHWMPTRTPAEHTGLQWLSAPNRVPLESTVSHWLPPIKAASTMV
ncbi:hypothetical protein DFH06DRAFT_1134956 [Mycena polygramma]|nr:hypothetical protein DFH06DRAFT_1134956 [Mycena polygramma]